MRIGAPLRAGICAIAALLIAGTAKANAGQDDGSGRDKPIMPGGVVASTIPPNGDLNPYGVAFVPREFPKGGPLHSGDILVSNFNNSQNLQGTGTTIVRVTPGGQTSLFFQGNAPLGLTTGLVILRKGFVVVGNFPSMDGTCQTAQPGSLLVIGASGNLVANLTHPDIAGPWDMTAVDEGGHAILFVSNALTGKVVRFRLELEDTPLLKDATTVASGYVHRCDPAAFVVSPTGLAFDEKKRVLFVASTGDNAVFAVEHALQRRDSVGLGDLVYQDNVHLHGPNGMALGPMGHLFVGNSDVINPDPNQPSEYVEFTTRGKFLNQLSVDPNQGGSFGVGVARLGRDHIRLAVVNDNANQLIVYTLRVPEPDWDWSRDWARGADPDQADASK